MKLGNTYKVCSSLRTIETYFAQFFSSVSHLLTSQTSVEESCRFSDGVKQNGLEDLADLNKKQLKIKVVASFQPKH